MYPSLPDEAALARWRRNYGNVGKCTLAWSPAWLIPRRYLMKLIWTDEEGIPDEAALAR